MNICVYGASSASIDRAYFDAAEALGASLASRGHTMIFGGGARGLMGAAARGAASRGGRIIGVAPSFFNVDGVLFDGCTEFIMPDTMRERKRIMEERSDAFIALPGGVGTLDEFFEVITLKQLGLLDAPVALFNVGGYYDALLALLAGAVAERFMTSECAGLFGSFEDAERLLDYIESAPGASGHIFKSL